MSSAEYTGYSRQIEMSRKARKRWVLDGHQVDSPYFSLDFTRGVLQKFSVNFGVILNTHDAKLYGIDFDHASRCVVFHCTPSSQEQMVLAAGTEVKKTVDMGLIPQAESTPAETRDATPPETLTGSERILRAPHAEYAT